MMMKVKFKILIGLIIGSLFSGTSNAFSVLEDTKKIDLAQQKTALNGGVEKDKSSKPEKQTEKWIVVLNDPRGERRKQWSGGAGYQVARNYQQSLALQRLGEQISKDYALTMVEQWPIKAIKVHCLVVAISPDEIEKLANLRLDKRVKWVQAYQIFEGLQKKPRSTTKTKNTNKLDFDSESQQPTEIIRGADPYRRFQTIFAHANIDKLTPKLNGSGVTIAMIDSGVEITHLDLKNTNTHYKNFVSNERQQIANTNSNNVLSEHPAEHHGTGVASVIIAQPNNGIGIVGIAPAAALYAYRGCWELADGRTRCDTLSLSRAFDSIVDLSPDILNLSLTGPEDFLLEQLLTVIIENGTTVVAAYDENRPSDKRFPIAREGVIFARDYLSADTNVPDLDKPFLDFVSVLGDEVLAAQPVNSYAYQSGNSYSSAHLTALLALIKQAIPDITSARISEILSEQHTRYTSNSQFDICKLLQSLNSKNNCS